MKVIYKYEVPVDDKVYHFNFPKEAEIVKVACQKDSNIVTFWAVIDLNQPIHLRFFTVVGTGQPFEDDYEYTGSCLTADANWVWHLLEINKR